jgi:hypothetical protein
LLVIDTLVNRVSVSPQLPIFPVSVDSQEDLGEF